jgi:hypothetical protein
MSRGKLQGGSRRYIMFAVEASQAAQDRLDRLYQSHNPIR